MDVAIQIKLNELFLKLLHKDLVKKVLQLFLSANFFLWRYLGCIWKNNSFTPAQLPTTDFVFVDMGDGNWISVT